MKRVSLMLLFNQFLKESADVTIADENGDIIYSGTVEGCPHNVKQNKVVTSISGIGDQFDIIINCTPMGGAE